MVELHGWLTIWETYEDEDLFSQDEIDAITQKVKEIVLNSNCGIEMKYMNGVPFISTLYCSNHSTKEVNDIIETYRIISKIATGSYGVIYLRDDEDSQYYNEFQIYLFKKGECIYRIDKDFSPCIPTIENGVVIEKL